MRKILVASENHEIYIQFLEYQEERQLKDFYKLYKKASGYTVNEYKTENGTTIAITNNSSSVGIGRRRSFGCFIRSEEKDITELISNSYKMLCYRYSVFKKYEEVFTSNKWKSCNVNNEIIKVSTQCEIDEYTNNDMIELFDITMIA